MEQRPLRLGDIVDDYCPRERRITNHAIVAIVNEGIRQTRCTTCEAEHVYKAAKVPRRRSSQADDGEQPGQLVVPRPADPPPPAAAMRADDASEEVALTEDIPAIEAHTPERVSESAADAPPAADEVWHTHRRLIRATLPRTEGEAPPPRPIPEFTMHQRPGRQGRGRWHGNGNSNGNVNGNGFGPDRRQGRNGPPGHGSGRPRRHRGKRSR